MSVRRNLAWVGLSQALFFVLSFGNSVIIARILGPYELGIYTIALATVGLIGTLQAFGLFGFIVREKLMTSDLQATTFTINAALQIVLSALIVLVSTLGGFILHEQGVRKVMLVLAIAPIINGLQFLPEANLQRNARFKPLSIISTGKTVISQGLAVILALKGLSYMSLAYSQLAASVFSVVAINIVGKEYISFRVRFSDWRRVSSFGVQMFLIGGVTSISTRATDFILGKMLGLGALGLYSRATSLNGLLWDNIHLVTGKVLFVDMASQKRAGDSLRNSYIKINDVNTVLLWPAFAGLAIVSGPFILAVYGAKWVSAAHPLCLITIGSMIFVSQSMSWDLFIIAGKTKTQTKIEYVRMLISVGLFFVGSLFSLSAAAASRVVFALITNSLYRPHVNDITDTAWVDFKRIFARNGLITLGAITPSAIVMAAYHASERAPLPYVGASILLGMLLWIALLIATRHPLRDEITFLLRRQHA